MYGVFRSLLRAAGNASKCSFATESARRTSLYDWHVQQGGNMVRFAGWLLPVQYRQGIKDSHLHVRAAAGLFDVSHMLQSVVHGKDRHTFIERLIPSNVRELPAGSGTLSVYTSESGGILDDLIVTETKEGFLYVVSNAACAEQDWEHMQRALSQARAEGLDVSAEILPDSLLALQGPRAEEALSAVCDKQLTSLYFMNSAVMSVAGVPNCRVTRCGYTGEDGFEISVPSDRAVHIANSLLASDFCLPAGLGARDTLRLEAGLCLYGNDIDTNTTPVEAGLAFVVGKRRRSEGSFPGADVIVRQLKDKPQRRRVGLRVGKGPPVRQGAVLRDDAGKEVGHVTSGCPSPSLQYAIAQAYVPRALSSQGTTLQAEVRGKLYPVEVTKMPFVPTKYYVKPKK